MTATSGEHPTRLAVGDLRGSPARRRRELGVRVMFLAAASVSILISFLIILSLVGEAWTFISQVDLPLLVERGWFPRRDLYSIQTIVAGTLSVATIGMLVAAPLGLGAAIYLAEYASPRVRRTIKPVLEILAGIPSVVLGYFALRVISPTVVDPICPGATEGFNMAAAGIGVGILITPLIASVAEDAMYAVPRSLREASYGLGARKRTTSLRIVLPAAISGIVAALILGFSRGIGETMVVSIAAGATGGSLFTVNPCEPGQTMTAAMTALATGSDQVRGATLAFPSLFFVGLLLFVFTLTLNLIADHFVRRVRDSVLMASTPRAQAMTAAEVVRRSIEGTRSDWRSIAFEGILVVLLVLTLGVLAWLLVVVFVNGIPTLAERGLDFLTSPLAARPEEAGVGQALAGSLWLMAFVALISFPLGIGAAVYLEEYAHDTWFTRLINTVVRNLAGVPSIVYGLLGLAVFVVALRDFVGPGSTSGRGLLAGGLTMAILVLPIVIITSAEALRAVPGAIREAAFGVGATRWEVVRSHVLPYAAPGIFTGTILSMARAFGETAPLILVGAVVGGFNVEYDSIIETLQGRYTALPTTVYDWARKPPSFEGNVYAAIIVLIVVLLVVNALAIYLRNRFERRW